MSGDIEACIQAADWCGARRLIEARLTADADNHWLLTRLSLTYYEERDYQGALKVSERALALAPRCPLVLWDHAGTLDMLGRCREAISIFRRLIKRGVDSIAHGECSEGVGWARGLIADCHYRVAGCYRKLGQKARFLREFEKHLDMRGPGCYSIYSLDEVAEEFDHVRGARANSG
jgi:tetratricopeptide (TPR) repeat protein